MSRKPFHEFCKDVLGLVLEEGQEVIARIAFGNEQPKDLPEHLRLIAAEMLGCALSDLDSFVVSKKAQRKIALSLGRGSGKTTMCSAFCIYEAVTANLDMCGTGDVPRCFIVAPDKPTAQLSITMAREMLRKHPTLNRMVTAEDRYSITIRRPQDGRLVVLEAKAASKGGATARGRTIICFILDEAEFFSSSGEEGEYAVNDRDIYRAMVARLIKGGKGMMISTPWPTENYMAECLEENWGKPRTALAMIAPTTMVRTDRDIHDMVEIEMQNDEENAKREFFCIRDTMVGGKFFDGISVGQAEHDYEYPLPHNRLYKYTASADFAFKRDSAAIVITQYDGHNYAIADMLELMPVKGKPLKPSEVVNEFAARCRRYGIKSIICDGHYRESIREHLAANDMYLREAPEGLKGKHDVYARTKAVLKEGRCIIPKDKSLRSQLLSTTSRPTAGGYLSIKHPRRPGQGHGDTVSAWTLCIHDMSYAMTQKEHSEYEPGTPEWQREFERRTLVAQEKQIRESIKREERAALRKMSPKQRRAMGLH